MTRNMTKMRPFVAFITYNNATKVFNSYWGEAAFETLLENVARVFEIPSNEVSAKMLCDLYGNSYTKDSFKEYVVRSIRAEEASRFRVITVELSDDTVTSSTYQSVCMEEVKQQDPEETDLSSGARSLISNSSGIKDNLTEADDELQLYEESDIESSNEEEPQPAKPTHSLNKPETDIEVLQREKEELDFLGRALLLLRNEFKSRMKKRENTLNRRDIESNKLGQRLNRQDENSQEVKTTCEESEAALQHYPLNKLEELLYGLASHMSTRKQLDEPQFDLHLRKANLDVKQEEREFNEGASTSNRHRSRILSERGEFELEMKVSMQKRRRSASSEISDEQPAKLGRPNTPLKAMLMDFNEASTSSGQPMKFNNLLKMRN